MLDLSKFNIPKEAKWVAMDDDGDLYAYTDEPHIASFGWGSYGENSWYLGIIDPSTIDWKKSLTCYNHVDTLLAALLSLDGVQECDLVAAFVRADPRRADAFCVTLAEALEPAQSAGAPNETD